MSVCSLMNVMSVNEWADGEARTLHGILYPLPLNSRSIVVIHLSDDQAGAANAKKCFEE